MLQEKESFLVEPKINQFNKERNYWLKKLSGDPEKSSFFNRVIEKPQSERKIEPVVFAIPDDISLKLLKLSNKSDPRLYMTLVTGLLVLIKKYTGNEDIIIGAPIFKQNVDAKFINTVMVLRNRVEDNITFKELLLMVRETLIEAAENINVPMKTLLYELNIPFQGDNFPLFDISVLLENIHDKKFLLHVKSNIVFSFSKRGSHISGVLEYNSVLCDRTFVERIISHFIELLRISTQNLDIKVGDINILSQKERKLLLMDFNNTETEFYNDMKIHELFDGQVKSGPGNVALIYNDVQLSYGKINTEADQLARVLNSKGVRTDTIVGIMSENSVEMIVGMLGILKAGGAYFPIDLAGPAERIKNIIEDACPDVLLIQEHLFSEKEDFFSCFNAKRMIVGDDSSTQQFMKILSFCKEPIKGKSENNGQTDLLAAVTGPSGYSGWDIHPELNDYAGTLAYVIYTSGTTGKSKGVLVSHRGIVNYINWRIVSYNYTKNDVTLQLLSYCFDGFVSNQYSSLLSGGKLLMLSESQRLDSNYVKELISQKGVTNLSVVPAIYKDILECADKNDLKSLRFVVLAGEKTQRNVIEKSISKAPGAELINEYGPTEASVTAAATEKIDKTNTTTIGVPLANTQIYILDKSLKSVPIRVPGEIYIGGIGVARGYLNNVELTDRKFIENPINDDKRLYKTGDVGEWNMDGQIDFLGRQDNQIKINGFRIELGEIETKLAAFAPVKEAVVVPYGEDTGDRRLAAYVVPDTEHSFVVSRLLKMEKKNQLSNLKRYDLPNGMVIFHLNKNETDFMYKENIDEQVDILNELTLTDDACIFDVGSNIGMFPIFLHQRFRNLEIYAFEPILPICELLRLNTSLYGINAKVFAYGIAGSERSADFTFYPKVSILSGQWVDISKDKNMVKTFINTQQLIDNREDVLADDMLDELLEDRLSTEQHTCKTKTLSQVIKENKVEKIDLLKIDIGRGEEDVLKGIRDRDWPKICQLIIEVQNINGKLERIAGLLDNYGYKVTTKKKIELDNSKVYNLFAVLPEHKQLTGIKRGDMNGRFNKRWYSPDILLDDLRSHLTKKLPGYMVPSKFILLDELPITNNGKINRKLLPVPESGTDNVEYVAPKTNLEKIISDIWKEVLEKERISIDDNFFDIGGNSLSITRVNNKMKEMLGEEIPVLTLFKYPTIKSISTYLSTEEAEGKIPIVANNRANAIGKAKKSRVEQKIRRKREI